MSQMTKSHSEEGTSEVLALSLPAAAENVMLVRQALDGAVRGLGASERIADDIKLAVTEACSNVVKYAYTSEVGRIVVELARNNDSVALVVADEGTWRPPDPSLGIEKSGMGIPLMEAVSTSFDLQSGDTGTRVAMTFALDGSMGA